MTKCCLPHHHPTTLDGNKSYPFKVSNHGCSLLLLWHSLQNTQRIRGSPQILPCISRRTWYISFIQLGCESWAVVSYDLFQSHQSPFVPRQDRSAKRSVEVMWQDKNDFEAVASSPESPLKSLKSSAAASIDVMTSNPKVS